MADILEEIAAYTKLRYAERKKEISEEEVKRQALSLPKGNFEFETRLKGKGLSFICEIKKASPSKGLISPDFPYLEIARDYERGGAACISCLTEPKWFLGKDEYLRQVRGEVSIPVLRKDFTVSSYQIYEAKVLGADAVLLIVSLLQERELQDYLALCDALGISALVEAHDEREIETALRCGARVIGVNNRNLRDFSVDVSNAGNFRNLVPQDKIFVSESGVKSRADIVSLEQNETDAVLVGEVLMRAKDRVATLRGLKNG